MKSQNVVAAAFVFFLICAGSPARADDGEIGYVQPAKAPLKAEANMTSATSSELTRGQKLVILTRQGFWLQVKTPDSGKSGWISKLSVAGHPPIGEAELAKSLDGNQNIGMAAHKRAGSVSVSASTRGLQAGNRGRVDRETYESDFDAVQKMESYRVDQNELAGFQQSAKLSE